MLKFAYRSPSTSTQPGGTATTDSRRAKDAKQVTVRPAAAAASTGCESGINECSARQRWRCVRRRKMRCHLDTETDAAANDVKRYIQTDDDSGEHRPLIICSIAMAYHGTDYEIICVKLSNSVFLYVRTSTVLQPQL